MQKHTILSKIAIILTILTLLSIVVVVVVAQGSEEQSDMTEEAMIARGAYLARIARCITCHTPRAEEFTAEELTREQQVALSLFGYSTLDVENQLMAGGSVFNLGAAGAVVASNLTSDEATGLGSWTDEEIETAMRIGVAADGRRLYPIMPYNSYYNWPQSEMDALIAYLRTLPAIENEVDRTGPEGDNEPKEMPVADDLLVAPPEDPVARGEYLVTTVMRCTGCHTPRDPRTGLPDTERWMGGGQAFEREWGIVYGGNVSPDEDTGIGKWTDAEIGRVFREGVRIDNRRLVLMPWQDYSIISDEDLDAVIAYMHSLEPIDNEVPAPAFEDENFLQYADEN